MSISKERLVEVVEEQLFLQAGFITYKHLSNALSISVNESKKLLNQYYEEHKDKDKKIKAILHVTGIKKGSPSVRSIKLIPVEEKNKLNEVFSQIISMHIYAIESQIKKEAVDVKNENNDDAKKESADSFSSVSANKSDKLFESDLCEQWNTALGTINFDAPKRDRSSLHVAAKSRDEVKPPPSPAPSPNLVRKTNGSTLPVNHKPYYSSSSSSKSSSKSSKKSSSQSKNTLMSMFNKASKKQTSSKSSTTTSSSSKSSKSKQESQKESKPTSKPSGKKNVISDDEDDEEEDVSDYGASDADLDFLEMEEESEAGSESASASESEESSTPQRSRRLKRKREVQEQEEKEPSPQADHPPRKRQKISNAAMDNDENDDDEDSNQGKQDDQVQDMIDDENDPDKNNDEEHSSDQKRKTLRGFEGQATSPASKKKTKKIRETKTYVNEKGYMVTEQVWKEVPVTDDEEEQEEEEKNTSKPKTKSKSKPKKSSSTKSKPVSSESNGKKQGNLMNFFSKK